MVKVPTMNADERAAMRSIVSSLFGNLAVAELLDTIERAWRTSFDDNAEIRAAILGWADEMTEALIERVADRGIAAPEFIRALRTRLDGLADLSPQLARVKQHGGGRYELREVISPAWSMIAKNRDELLSAHAEVA